MPDQHINKTVQRHSCACLQKNKQTKQGELDSVKGIIFSDSINDRMPPVAKKKMARTHLDSLQTVCAACWKKTKNVRSVTDKMADLITQFVFSGYNSRNGSSICPV